MKSLKITFILAAVFCLTIAGTSTTQEKQSTVEIQQIDKQDFDYVATVVKKNKKPSHEM